MHIECCVSSLPCSYILCWRQTDSHTAWNASQRARVNSSSLQVAAERDSLHAEPQSGVCVLTPFQFEVIN